MMNKQYQRLGDILKKQGLISSDQLKSALKIQKKSGRPLGKILKSQNIVSEEALARALAVQKNLDVVDLTEYEVSLIATALINEDVAKRLKVLPIDFIEDRLLVAVANPLDIHAVDSVKMITGHNIQTVVATESSIENAIRNYLSGPSNIKETVEEAVRAQAEPVIDLQEVIDDDSEPVVRLVNMILTKALRERASDVHIECQENSVNVRYRVDGVLRDAMVIPRHLRSSVVSRFKIMCGMDIAERRRPQDGRMSLEIDGTGMDFRASTLPGLFGENMVLRLLTAGKTLIKLESLGMSGELLSQCREALTRSHGALLVTGPTGSGKTTTLYAMIDEINDSEKKIVTLEDPIESPMAGLTQLQINRKFDLDFANGLRAILRSDPDIVMVGEIRDIETAQIAIRGALTGHLVLSSLHTNDATSAITRLVDMGLDPYLVASSI
ncbi:MAG TPA: type II/IV secretion system protein, partial [Actinobacteria bacterium]|nr:type II/IV secretion system protein [Actinomycetota bacterium]